VGSKTGVRSFWKVVDLVIGLGRGGRLSVNNGGDQRTGDSPLMGVYG